MRTEILIFLPSLAPHGAQRTMTWLASELDTEGLNVEVVVSAPRDRASRSLLVDALADVQQTYLGVSRVRSAVLPLARHLRDRQPRAVMSTLEHASIVGVAAILLARTRTPLVIRQPNHLSSIIAAQRGVLRRGISLALIRWAYRRASAIVAVAEDVAVDLERQLKRPGSRSITVIPNAVDRRLAVTKAAESFPFIKLLPNDGAAVIVSIGRLEFQKGVDILIRAFAELHHYIDSRLIIAGEGSLKEELQELASSLGVRKSTTFLGYVKNPYSLLNHADLFVLPSRFEGFPSTLVQALALDRKVIVTDCPGGPQEIVGGGKYGRVVPTEDAPGLAKAMALSLTTASPAPRPSEALDRFEPHQVVTAYREIFDRVTSESRSRPRAHRGAEGIGP